MAGVPLLFLMVSCDAPGGERVLGARIERFVLTPSVVDLPADWSAAAFTDAIRDAAARWSDHAVAVSARDLARAVPFYEQLWLPVPPAEPGDPHLEVITESGCA